MNSYSRECSSFALGRLNKNTGRGWVARAHYWYHYRDCGLPTGTVVFPVTSPPPATDIPADMWFTWLPFFLPANNRP